MLRWGSFFISVINHDESTYIVIADELLRGEVYLRDVIDTKPIGIFWIYAALIKLTGGSIPALRLAAAAVVGVGGWGLYLAGRRALHDRVGIAAGLLYCFICSVFTFYGVSPNTEIFFNVLTIGAVALAVAPRVRSGPSDAFWHWPVAGLLLGTATLIKPFVAAESLAVGLFVLYFYGRAGSWRRLFLAGAALVAAYALPLVAVFLYYRHLGMLETLRFYLLDVNGAYPIELPWYLRLKYMGDYLLRFSPLVLLFAATQVQWKGKGTGSVAEPRAGIRTERQRWIVFLLVQFLLVTIVVLITGKRFGHYQVQLHPPLAALAACWWALDRPVSASRAVRWARTYAPALLIVLAGVLGTVHFQYYRGKDDKPARIADYLAPRLGPEETYFGLNGWQITYHLLDRPVPTPYVHSSLLFLEHHRNAFQIDEAAEAARLLADPSLMYLCGRATDPDTDTALKARLLAAFSPVDTLPGDIVVYRRSDLDGLPLSPGK